MRVLGVDPGSLKTGWSVVERRGTKLTCVASGTLRQSSKISLHDRLLYMNRRISEMICGGDISVLAVEDQYIGDNKRTVMAVIGARFAATMAAAEHHVNIAELAPALVKRSVAGHGSAQKADVNRAVRHLLDLDRDLQEDEADACAVAITAIVRWRQIKETLANGTAVGEADA